MLTEVPPQNSDHTNAMPMMPPGLANKLEKQKEQANIPAPGGAVPQSSFMPAPENSEVSTTMKPDGSIYEVRRFKDNPQIASAESIWTGLGPKRVKIVLKNGRVVNTATERMENLFSAPVSLLLELAGVRPQPPQASDTQSKSATKKLGKP
jgi:hypothetical protein